jgi:hypothetical protein
MEPADRPEWLTRALEGEHRWGYIDVVPAARTVWSLQRLTVFPPGICSADRRMLKRHRDWPMIGAVLALFLMIALGDVWPTPIAVLVVALAYAGGVWASSRLTHELRARSHCIEVTSTAGVDGYSTHGDTALLESARIELLGLEARLRRGELNAVDFEAGWGRVYDRIAEPPQD